LIPEEALGCRFKGTDSAGGGGSGIAAVSLFLLPTINLLTATGTFDLIFLVTGIILL
jgi:hypothetical protein